MTLIPTLRGVVSVADLQLLLMMIECVRVELMNLFSSPILLPIFAVFVLVSARQYIPQKMPQSCKESLLIVLIFEEAVVFTL